MSESTAPTPKVPRRRELSRRLAPLAAWALGLAPLAKIAADALRGGLGANPIEAILNRLGFWTLTFLALTLSATPLKEVFGWTAPLRVRRMLGLFAFGYGVTHFAFYVGVDKFFDWRTIAVDLTKRPFIMVGFATLLVLLPLAVTSTDGWVRRLGYTRWKRLHRLVYAAAVLAVVHFLWRVKADHRRPLLFAALFGALFAARLPGLFRARARSRAASGRTSRELFGA